MNASGSALVFSSYLGSTGFDWASGIALGTSGNIHLTGYTSSSRFPTISPTQSSFNGLYDAFLATISGGDTLLFSTFLGGAGADTANAIAADGAGNIYVGGQSSSLDLPLKGAIQSTNVGGSTAWVARWGSTATAPQPPSVVSVSPASGRGNTVTFTAVYTAGKATIASAGLLVNSTAVISRACNVSYNALTSQLTLSDNTGASSFTTAPGGGSVQNDQCVLNAGNSLANLSGTTLTLTISLSFQAGFTGPKSVFLTAADSTASSGLVARGTWTAIAPQPTPSADSVSPNGGSGSSQDFSFVFSDTQSALNVTGMAMLFADSISYLNACYIVYDRNAGTVALLWDGANGSDTKLLNSPTVLRNSQCRIGAASATQTGLSNIVTLTITFEGRFSGMKNIYMFAAEQNTATGWVKKGTFQVASGGVPVASSVVPAAGSGPHQRFSFTISDQGGAGFLNGAAMLIAVTPDASNACNIVYDRTSNTLSLSYDDPRGGATPVTPGSNNVAFNSQCILSGATSTVAAGTTSVVITVDLAFNSAYFGSKNIYLNAVEPGVRTGYVQVGNWTVTGGAPTSDFMTPGSGSGLRATFAFQVSDSSSAQNISGMSILFTTGSPINTANACYLVYLRGANIIALYADNGLMVNSKGIGSSATLDNSQCSVGYSVMNSSGTSLTLAVNLEFKSAFQGGKSVYLQADEPGSDSGWVSRGTWTIP